MYSDQLISTHIAHNPEFDVVFGMKIENSKIPE